MTSTSPPPNAAPSGRMSCHLKATIEYQGRHYSVRIGQIEARRLILHPLVILSIPANVDILVHSADLGRIQARVNAISSHEIIADFAQVNSAIDLLLGENSLKP